MKQRNHIALMVDLDWPLKRHHEVIAGIHRFAQDRGDWKLFTDLYPERALDRYDAVVGRVSLELAEKAAKAGIPVVNTWFSSPAGDIPSVFPDFEAVARMAADHLMARGFQKFGFVGFSEKWTRVLRDAFAAHLRSAGYPCSVMMVSPKYTESAPSWDTFSTKLETWMDSWSPPIGLFCSEDQLGCNVVPICDYKGLVIPQQVALVSVHNEPIYCLSSKPPLTSIDLEYEQIGFQAARLLHDLMRGKRAPAKPVLVRPHKLVPRNSSDAYVVDDATIARALRFIAEHSHEAIKVDDVARGVSITRRTLERLFEKEVDRTVAQEIARFRIERLKRLLIQTTRPIKYLAQEVGFKGANQMYVTFHRLEGISPSEYRRQQGGRS